MLSNLPPLRTTHVPGHAQLDAHFAGVLGCSDTMLRTPGLHVVPCAQRHEPDAARRLRPLVGVAPAGSGAYILSCLPELEAPLLQTLASLPATVLPFDEAWLAAVRAAVGTLPAAEWLMRRIYAVDRTTFRPHGVDPSVKIERWEADAPPPAGVRRAVDGPIFVVRASDGTVAAWAAISCISDYAWEVEAVTDPAYRGRGLATVLTAAATDLIVGRDLAALWMTELDNTPAQRLVERLGYTVYGHQMEAVLAPLADASRTG